MQVDFILPERLDASYVAHDETVANQSFYPTFQENHQSDFLETESSSNRFLRCSSIFNTFRCSEADSPRIRAKIFDLRQSHDGTRKRPVMLHRAILGTLERFIGILIENCAGKFPLWLSPVQMVVATITNDSDEYAAKVLEKLKAQGFRAEADFDAQKINYKIREHSFCFGNRIFCSYRF